MRARWWKPVRLTKILATGTIYHLTIRGILNWEVAVQSEDRAVDLEGVVRSEHLYESWLDRDFSRDVTSAMLVYSTIVKKVLFIRFYYHAKLERHFAIVLYTNMAVSSREWKPRLAFFPFNCWNYRYVLGPVSRKFRKLFGPGKPFVKLRPAYSVKMVFSYVVKGIKNTNNS